MDIRISTFLTFEQLGSHPLWDLSAELEHHGIDVTEFFTARLAKGGIYFEQGRNVRHRAA